jgi:hypothetical protein
MVVLVRPVGAYTTEELQDAWLEAERSPRFPAAPVVCVDVRETASLVDRSVAEIRATTRWFIARARATNRICALVAREGTQYGLARMISVWLELNGFHVFVTTDADDAIRWLAQKTDGST